MLLGEFRHSLDPKGRVHVPAPWRDELTGEVVLAPGLDGCLYLMSAERFRTQAEKLSDLPLERRTNRAYSRRLFSGAAPETVDKQGRVTIPARLREAAALGKSVVLVGVSDRGEIWNLERWNEYSSKQDYEELAEKLDL